MFKPFIEGWMGLIHPKDKPELFKAGGQICFWKRFNPLSLSTILELATEPSIHEVEANQMAGDGADSPLKNLPLTPRTRAEFIEHGFEAFLDDFEVTPVAGPDGDATKDIELDADASTKFLPLSSSTRADFIEHGFGAFLDDFEAKPKAGATEDSPPKNLPITARTRAEFIEHGFGAFLYDVADPQTSEKTEVAPVVEKPSTKKLRKKKNRKSAATLKKDGEDVKPKKGKKTKKPKKESAVKVDEAPPKVIIHYTNPNFKNDSSDDGASCSAPKLDDVQPKSKSSVQKSKKKVCLPKGLAKPKPKKEEPKEVKPSKANLDIQAPKKKTRGSKSTGSGKEGSSKGSIKNPVIKAEEPVEKKEQIVQTDKEMVDVACQTDYVEEFEEDSPQTSPDESFNELMSCGGTLPTIVEEEPCVGEELAIPGKLPVPEDVPPLILSSTTVAEDEEVVVPTPATVVEVKERTYDIVKIRRNNGLSPERK